MSAPSFAADLPPLVAIVGPTAVGKTAFGIELAQQMDGEVVSADSRQVYRGMDIGTAKPTPAEQRQAPHHLLDVVAPDEDFSLARYQDMAMAAIGDITARGRVPLLVGGTGQYLAAVLEGWNIPRVAPQWEFRAALEHEAEEQGSVALHERLTQIDPSAAAAIQPTNLRRIIRALEVYHVTGQPISAQQTRSPPPYHITTWWLTLPAEPLYARIDARVDAMMEAGLLNEVYTLLARDYGWHLPSMSSLGYIQFRPYVEGSATLEACVQRLKFDTHRFARQQKNWFRRLPGVVRLDQGAE
jgi:tRNA dimethylallyltransferase